MKHSTKLALSGVMTALCVVLMFLTGIFPGATYSLPAIAGFLLGICVKEIGTKWSVAIFISSAILSLILAADKEAAILYTAFFGYYPIVKCSYERLSNKILEYVLKLITFNISVILVYSFIIFILKVPDIDLSFFGLDLPLIFLIIGNFSFILYDITITRVINAYYKGFHKHIRKIIRFNVLVFLAFLLKIR